MAVVTNFKYFFLQDSKIRFVKVSVYLKLSFILSSSTFAHASTWFLSIARGNLKLLGQVHLP